MRDSLIYKHGVTGEYLLLLTVRESGINTFLQVDKSGKPVIAKRVWSTRPDKQRRLINGFDNLITLCSDNQ